MTRRKKRWLIAIAAVLGLIAGAIFIAASILAKRFEPMLREQAIQYLRQRFNSEVELTSLHVHPPKMSALQMVMGRGRGAKVRVEGEGLAMRFAGLRELPPLFSIAKFSFVVDLGILSEPRKIVDSVVLEDMQINVPPKGERANLQAGAAGAYTDDQGRPNVLIQEVHIRHARLVILPKDATRNPMRFDIDHMNLESVGVNSPMKYDSGLTIPKPPGMLHSTGSFGPWVAAEPGDTPLEGEYNFRKADLGVFNGIAGILASTGTFDGTLDSVHARGEAKVPDFRLKMTGTPVPLATRFEVLVDGTNGNTELRPVHVTLGRTSFTTTGAVIKHEKQTRRTIKLNVAMPDGDMRDLLRLAAKGPPFMEGRIKLNAKVDIPPLSGPVKEKLLLDGEFEVRDAKFLKTTIQDQIDQLSRRGQGQPKNEEIDEVVSDMGGAFRLENRLMTFKSLSFGVPGAYVHVAGDYDLDQDALDFHGSLRLAAKISQTQSGWKRWALKPADPFFAKNGAGTFLRIQIVGTSRQPKFGMDHTKRGAKVEAASSKGVEAEPPVKPAKSAVLK